MEVRFYMKLMEMVIVGPRGDEGGIKAVSKCHPVSIAKLRKGDDLLDMTEIQPQLAQITTLSQDAEIHIVALNRLN